MNDTDFTVCIFLEPWSSYLEKHKSILAYSKTQIHLKFFKLKSDGNILRNNKLPP